MPEVKTKVDTKTTTKTNTRLAIAVVSVVAVGIAGLLYFGLVKDQTPVSEPGGTCDENSVCVNGLVCVSVGEDSGTSGECHEPLGVPTPNEDGVDVCEDGELATKSTGELVCVQPPSALISLKINNDEEGETCTNDNDCSSEEYCESITSECLTRSKIGENCNSLNYNRDCLDDLVCFTSSGNSSCQVGFDSKYNSDTDFCEEGYTIGTYLKSAGELIVTCIINDYCESDLQCGEGFACVNNNCIDSKDKCTSNEECGMGRICSNSKCICNSDEICPVGQVCINGNCTLPFEEAGCTTSEECGAGLSCFNGLCISQIGDTCINSNECPTGQACNKNSNTCYIPASAECTGNDQCSDNEICYEGFCIAAPTTCTVESDCASDQSCVNEECVLDEDILSTGVYEVCLPDDLSCPDDVDFISYCTVGEECEEILPGFIKVCPAEDSDCALSLSGEEITQACNATDCDTTVPGIIKVCPEGESCEYNEGDMVIPYSATGIVINPQIIYRNNSRVILEWQSDDTYAATEQTLEYGEDELTESVPVYESEDGTKYAVIEELKGGEFTDMNDDGYINGRYPYKFRVKSGNDYSQIIPFKTLNRFQTIVYFYNMIFAENNDLRVEEPTEEIRSGGPNFYYKPEVGEPMTLEGVKFAILNDRLFEEYDNRLAATAAELGEEQVVKNLYAAIHDRIYEEDLRKYYDDEGLAFWMNELTRDDSNRISLPGVKYAFTISPEFREVLAAQTPEDKKQFIDADFAYEVVLKRGGDIEGVEYLTESFATFDEMKRQLAKSEEFDNRITLMDENLGRKVAIEELYETLFGRAGDIQGVDYWDKTDFAILQIRDFFLEGENN